MTHSAAHHPPGVLRRPGRRRRACRHAGLQRRIAQSYPQRNFRVMIPTGQGGGAERLARAFDDAWSKLLKRQFEYPFHPGAAGQIGYELFVKRASADGYNLLFGNMGPEMIMYAVQKPDYRFPEDFIYFCRIDIDDSCIFVRNDSPYKDVKSVVEAAKKKPLNVAVSRIPHPASIGMLALGEATGSRLQPDPLWRRQPDLCRRDERRGRCRRAADRRRARR